MAKEGKKLSPAKQRRNERRLARVYKPLAPMSKPNVKAKRAERRAKRRQMRAAAKTRPAPARIDLNCMHCGEAISVKANRKKDLFCCPHCRGVMDVSPFLRRTGQ